MVVPEEAKCAGSLIRRLQVDDLIRLDCLDRSCEEDLISRRPDVVCSWRPFAGTGTHFSTVGVSAWRVAAPMAKFARVRRVIKTKRIYEIAAGRAARREELLEVACTEIPASTATSRGPKSGSAKPSLMTPRTRANSRSEWRETGSGSDGANSAPLHANFAEMATLSVRRRGAGDLPKRCRHHGGICRSGFRPARGGSHRSDLVAYLQNRFRRAGRHWEQTSD
jgi:hypothetical protein